MIQRKRLKQLQTAHTSLQTRVAILHIILYHHWCCLHTHMVMFSVVPELVFQGIEALEVSVKCFLPWLSPSKEPFDFKWMPGLGGSNFVWFTCINGIINWFFCVEGYGNRENFYPKCSFSLICLHRKMWCQKYLLDPHFHRSNRVFPNQNQLWTLTSMQHSFCQDQCVPCLL